MAVDLEGKVCPAHPDRPAVGRCIVCFKPVCKECLVRANGQDYCSQKCADTHAKTSKTFDRFIEQERLERRRRLIRRIVYTILFLIVAYVAISFWVRNPETVETWIAMMVEMVVSAKDGVMEIVQGLTG